MLVDKSEAPSYCVCSNLMPRILCVQITYKRYNRLRPRRMPAATLVPVPTAPVITAIHSVKTTRG